MKALGSFTTVLVLAAAVFFLGRVEQLRLLLGVIVPYAAVATFLVGVSYRVVRWSLSPVPFRIPTVCGQQKSLPWIKASWLESPSRTVGVVARMALEILPFRSLFRNTKAELRQGPRLTYGESKFLWLAASAFHWSFLIIFLRHLRFFMEPVPRAGASAREGGQLLPDRRSDPLCHRRRRGGGAPLPAAKEAGRSSSSLHLLVGRLFRPLS